MCGLFAIFLKRPLAAEDIAVGRRATLALAHRGPDGAGEWIDAENGVFIGHRRLTIVDLSDASAQPMRRGDWVLASNGEIYGYQALRERLQALGLDFRTTGDTEVLLNAWRHWGEACLDELDGMFAFVIWDGERAHAATDPFGEKPLYYAETDDGVYFSSEIGPLVDALGLAPELGSDALMAFLAIGTIPAPDTAYPTVRRAPAASLLRVEGGRVTAERQYWTPPWGEPGRGPVAPLSEPAIDRLEEVLTTSLEDRFQADVPVCAFLSSGVDSTLVAALATRRLGREVPCLTVAFRQGRAVDEAPAAAAIAGYLKQPHQVLESGTVTDNVVGDLFSLFGQPNDNLTVLSVREMSRLARRQYKVALTGLGGDELFFGYRKHHQMYRLRPYLGLPEGLRVWGGRAAHRFRGLHPRLGQVADLVGLSDDERYAAQKTQGIVHWLRELPGWNDWARRHFSAPDTAIELLGPRYDVARTMPDSLLTAQDLASMRESLELRCPFLNRKLMGAVAEHDPRAFLAFGRKSVLYRMLYRHVPKTLLHESKFGFTYPSDRFLAAFGDRRPELPGLAPALIDKAWRRRTEGDNWRRISIRMALASTFLADRSEARRSDPVIEEAAAAQMR
ncbi:MAG: asparagine synthase (glutamine-hydrolyzing) [Alphaproteobacteria bacterium]|jgi:asparagine synthase (glutamine-hydrolysing)|nr:asparagine synthase (glutamine-hydrolyzing) [Alphaproteobacteria bacterium]